ncbi:hypothetical protein NP233_g4643 [Leucocoprinus birnbaumii]|uniref:Uncharacterized protein n=1 Tax=Leucocoprinus birnbaumii TaxID=56174 RepID=A0AAD5YSL8_9AGAR|nr:hypothetical protein NP233_g4643 [Leucocoprinus birnbaumii]
MSNPPVENQTPSQCNPTATETNSPWRLALGQITNSQPSTPSNQASKRTHSQRNSADNRLPKTPRIEGETNGAAPMDKADDTGNPTQGVGASRHAPKHGNGDQPDDGNSPPPDEDWTKTPKTQLLFDPALL